MGLLKKVKKAVKKVGKVVTDPGNLIAAGLGGAGLVDAATLGLGGKVVQGAANAVGGLLGGLMPKQPKPGPDGSLSQEQLAANRPSWLSNMPTQGYGQQFAPKAGFDNPLFARLFGQQQMGQLQQQLGAGSWNPPQAQGLSPGTGMQQGMQPPAWAQMPQMGMAQPKPLYSPGPQMGGGQFTTQIQPPQPGSFFNPFGS